MAHFGNIGKYLGKASDLSTNYKSISFYAGEAIGAHFLPSYGKISGRVVSAPEVGIPFHFIYCIFEPTGMSVGRVKTDQYGYFEFKDLYIGGPTKTYTIIASKTVDKNSKCFSSIQPYNPFI